MLYVAFEKRVDVIMTTQSGNEMADNGLRANQLMLLLTKQIRQKIINNIKRRVKTSLTLLYIISFFLVVKSMLTISAVSAPFLKMAARCTFRCTMCNKKVCHNVVVVWSNNSNAAN